MDAKKLVRLALKSDRVKKAIGNKEIREVIYVPNKVINFVLEK